MIFISYSRTDGDPYATELEARLHSRQFQTWRDVRELHPDRDFTADIEKAIESASHVVVCITPDSKREDSFVRREIQYALAVKKPVIPFRCAEIPPHVSIVNNEWLDHHKNAEAAIGRLIEIVSGAPYANKPDDTESDPFRPYLQELYQSIVNGLAQRIIVPIDLDVKPTPDAVNAPPPPPKTHNLIDQFFSGVKMNVETSATEEKRDFKTFAEGFEAYSGRVLLLGEPGAGKTITLMAYARDAISARLNDRSKPLPLFGLVPTWDAEKQTPLHEWLSAPFGLDKDIVKGIIEQGKAILLLDGLDELGREQEVKDQDGTPITYDPRLRFVNILPSINQILLTSRIEEYTEIGEKAVLDGAITLQSLSDGQMAYYLRDQPHLWALIQQDEQLKEVARTPLLMSLFAFAYRDLADEEREQLTTLTDARDLRDKIFLRYIEQRYRHEDAKFNVRLPISIVELMEYLGRLAMNNFLSWHAGANIVGPGELRALSKSFSVDEMASLLMQLNILVGDRDQTLRFVHLLLRDTLTYQYAYACLFDAQLPHRKSAPSALEKLKDTRAVDALIHALNDEDAFLRRYATTALGRLKDHRAFEPLVQLLDHRDSHMKRAAIEALGILGDPRAAAILIARRPHFPMDYAHIVVTALENIGTPEALANIGRRSK